MCSIELIDIVSLIIFALFIIGGAILVPLLKLNQEINKEYIKEKDNNDKV